MSSDPELLRVGVDAEGVVRLTGELDVATAPQLRAILDRLLNDGARHLVLDVTNLGFCDSSGLSVFVWAHQTLAGRAGTALVLRGPGDRLRQLLRITQLDGVFDVR